MSQELQPMQARDMTLLLPSLHIQGFRAFQNLEIPCLGRVNLIVGKNNVGKTTVLEALRLYAAGMGAHRELRNLLLDRQEFNRGSDEADYERAFHAGTAGLKVAASRLEIGPINSTESLRIRLGWAKSIQNENGIRTRTVLDSPSDEEPDEDPVAALIVEFSAHARRIHVMNMLRRDFPQRSLETEGATTCQYVLARGLERIQVGKLWDSIVLTAQEQDVLRALQIIAPEIERVSLVEALHARERFALIIKKNSTIPEPIRSLGDGMNRIFELALGLVNSRKGLFLVDEVDNGVHYSAQEQLWRFIFAASSTLGVQVFATTHSWDCIQAFQQAASSHKEAGALIRLSRHDDAVRATVFNERELEILTRESIEVR